MWRDAAIGTALATLVFLVGWDLMGPGAGAAAAAADTHEQGRRVYNFRCYFCHGYSGDAKTLAATYLQPPPRDFTRAAALTRERIAATLLEGRPGTAMASFAGTLAPNEIDAVAAFVEREFVRERAPNTRYHTVENGWPGHERHAAAFPFARGEIALDAPDESLDAAQRAGRRLFLATCVSCHDRGRVDDAGPVWSARPISYPRMGFVPGQPNTPPVDAVSSASVYAKHEVPPQVEGLSAREKRGEALFQANCAFCHGADGTGKNWIGQFMEPKARDLTAYSAAQMPPARLKRVIREGLPGTSMPAWQHVLRASEIDAIAAYVGRAMVGTQGTPVAAAR
jgi:cytochrome c oxidase cbb3-type subunit 3